MTKPDLTISPSHKQDRNGEGAGGFRALVVHPALKLPKEKEALGFYITGHPLSRYADDVRRYATHTCASLSSA